MLGAAALSACASAPSAPRAQSYADFLIARVANLREDHAVASDRFYTALQSAPRDAYLLEGGVRTALAAGDSRRAREVARIATSRNVTIPAADLVRAVDALEQGRWSSARALLDGVDGDLDEEFAARLMIVWAKAGEGRTDEALADIRRLSAPRPYSGVFVYQEALALDLAGRNEEALTAYARARQEGLWLPPGLVRHADMLLRMGRRDDAVTLLETIAAASTNPEIELALARVRANEPLGTPPLRPSSGAALGLYGLGALLSRETDTDAGLVILSLAQMLDPGLEAARIAFAEAQRDKEQNQAARATLAGITSQSPYAETASMMTAWILRDEGKQDEALAAARAAAEGGGRRARTAYGDLLRSFDRYADAEPIYDALISESAADWRLFFARGAARERLGRWEEAETDLQRALEIEPDQPDVMNYLGYTWVDRGENLEQGLAMLTRAVELRPNSGAVLDSLGWAHYRLGHYEQALSYLERAVELEPSDPILNDHLGDNYWRVGRRTEARFQWRRVLTLEPAQTLRTEAERKIEAGLPNAPLAENRR